MEHFQLFQASEVQKDDKMKVYDHNSIIYRCVPRLSSVLRFSSHLSFLIKVIGKRIILKGIVEDLNDAPFTQFLWMRSHLIMWNICQFVLDLLLAIVISEEFLAFLKLERITGQKIADTILQFLQEKLYSYQKYTWTRV